MGREIWNRKFTRFSLRLPATFTLLAEYRDQNIWLSTTLVSGSWDENQRLYTLTITRNGIISKLTAKHVVFATGAGSQVPLIPEWPDKVSGQILFQEDTVMRCEI